MSTSEQSVALTAFSSSKAIWYRPGLTGIPEPALAKWTKLWRLYDVYAGSSHRTAIRLHQKYGPLVRIAPNVVSVGDPQAVKVIYDSTEAFQKVRSFMPPWAISDCYLVCLLPNPEYLLEKKPLNNLFSTRDPVYHREQIWKVGETYNMTNILGSEAGVDSCTQLFLGRIDEWATTGEPIDLGQWLQYYAFDVVGEVTFAKKLGLLRTGGDVDTMMGSIGGVLVYASLCGQVPELHPFLLGNPLFPILVPAMESWNTVLNFTLKAINARTSIQRRGELGSTVGGKDLLSRLAAVKEKDPLKMSTRDITACIYFLIKNPEKVRKTVREIDAAQKAGKLSHLISYKESTTHRPYVAAVIKNAMRIHPSVGLHMERHIPAGGVEISGTYIPGGTIVGINPWVLAL